MTSEQDPLKALEDRISAAQKAREPAPPKETKFQKANMAWRMVTELVSGMLLGLGIGYGLDWLLGTLPIFLVLFALLGFAAGVRTMIATAQELQKDKSAPAGSDETNAHLGESNGK